MIPVLFLPALMIFLFTAGKSVIKREVAFFTVASGAALTGILSIAFILTLLTITSYSEIERAMHSAYPMVLLFIVAAVLDAVTRMFPHKRVQD